MDIVADGWERAISLRGNLTQTGLIPILSIGSVMSNGGFAELHEE